METSNSAEIRKQLGINIRNERERQGLSLRRLGWMTGVDYKGLHRIEQGSANPTVSTLGKIAAGLGITLSELFAGIGDAEAMRHSRS